MVILSITGAKGGTGKSSVAVTLAAELSGMGHRVALRDLDPQASATLALGCAPASNPLRGDPVELAPNAGGFTLYPGGRMLAKASREDVARALMDAVKDPGLLVLDCPPALGGATLEAVARASVALVPVEPSPIGLPGLLDILGILKGREGGTVARAVFTRVQGRRTLTRQIREKLAEEFPGLFYDSEIPEDVRAAEAPSHGQPVTLYAPRSRAADAYRSLAREVARDLKEAATNG